MASARIHSETKYWAALTAVKGIGRHTIWQLYKALKKSEVHVSDFWVSGPLLWKQYSIRENIVNSILKFKKEHSIDSYWESLVQKDIRVVTAWSSQYPVSLTHIDDPPPLLYIRGSSLLNDKPSRIAVVGSRNATPYGRYAAHSIARELAEGGITIVSGCMYGIDEIAHRASLAAGGMTIGVLGYGCDFAQPSSVRRLQDAILGGEGSLVSEYAPNVPPRAGLFAQRNRIIAGLCLGVVVVEAAEKSGSLITAQCALDQGRTVFAIPGPFFSPYSAGTKWLINQGAIMTTCSADILGELDGQDAHLSQQPLQQTTVLGNQKEADAGNTTLRLYSSIQTLLKDHGLHADEICQGVLTQPGLTTLTPETINRALTELELSGSIMRSGFWYELCQSKYHL